MGLNAIRAAIPAAVSFLPRRLRKLHAMAWFFCFKPLTPSFLTPACFLRVTFLCDVFETFRAEIATSTTTQINLAKNSKIPNIGAVKRAECLFVIIFGKFFRVYAPVKREIK